MYWKNHKNEVSAVKVEKDIIFEYRSLHNLSQKKVLVRESLQKKISIDELGIKFPLRKQKIRKSGRRHQPVEFFCTNQRSPQLGGVIHARLSSIKMVVGLSEGTNYLEHYLHKTIFSVLPPEQTTARSLSEIGRLFPLPAETFILTLAQFFPCLVCARDMIWRNRSVQCCTCS